MLAGSGNLSVAPNFESGNLSVSIFESGSLSVLGNAIYDPGNLSLPRKIIYLKLKKST